MLECLHRQKVEFMTFKAENYCLNRQKAFILVMDRKYMPDETCNIVCSKLFVLICVFNSCL